MNDNAQRLAQLNKEVMKVNLIDAPASVMVALGLYAKFAAKGHAFLPILDKPHFADYLIIAGLPVMVWCGIRIFKLSRERATLMKQK